MAIKIRCLLSLKIPIPLIYFCHEHSLILFNKHNHSFRIKTVFCYVKYAAHRKMQITFFSERYFGKCIFKSIATSHFRFSRKSMVMHLYPHMISYPRKNRKAFPDHAFVFSGYKNIFDINLF